MPIPKLVDSPMSIGPLARQVSPTFAKKITIKIHILEFLWSPFNLEVLTDLRNTDIKTFKPKLKMTGKIYIYTCILENELQCNWKSFP